LLEQRAFPQRRWMFNCFHPSLPLPPPLADLHLPRANNNWHPRNFHPHQLRKKSNNTQVYAMVECCLFSFKPSTSLPHPFPSSLPTQSNILQQQQQQQKQHKYMRFNSNWSLDSLIWAAQMIGGQWSAGVSSFSLPPSCSLQQLLDIYKLNLFEFKLLQYSVSFNGSPLSPIFVADTTFSIWNKKKTETFQWIRAEWMEHSVATNHCYCYSFSFKIDFRTTLIDIRQCRTN